MKVSKIKKIDNAIFRLARLNYTTAKSYYLYRLKRKDACFEKAPIVVYQMGKVGSSTITKSLHQLVLDRNIYHVHFLSPDRVAEYEDKRKELLNTKYLSDLQHIWQYIHLRQRLKRYPNEGWKLITLVRDPVARNLATFFEHIEVKTSTRNGWHLASREYDFDLQVDADNLRPLIELFFEKCRHEAPIEYFDKEYKKVLGVDLFKKPFSSDKGYSIVRENSHEVLTLKLESLNDSHKPAMKEFLGINEFSIANANLGENKKYADVYRMFKDEIKLPSEYIERLYSSKMAQHFYTPNELDQFRQRWVR